MVRNDVTDILADILQRHDIKLTEDRVEDSFTKELIHIINKEQDLIQ